MFSRSEDEPSVEVYLDRVERTWGATVPAERRHEMREELRGHLAAAVAAEEARGAGPRDAARAAIGRFGDARVHGRALLREWRRTERRSSPRAAAAFAARCFLLLAALDMAVAFALPPGSPMLTGARMPVWLSVGSILWICAGSAIVGGWIVGRACGARASRATLAGMACTLLVLAALLAVSVKFGGASRRFDLPTTETPDRYALRYAMTSVYGASGMLMVLHVVRLPLALLGAAMGRWRRGAPRQAA